MLKWGTVLCLVLWAGGGCCLRQPKRAGGLMRIPSIPYLTGQRRDGEDWRHPMVKAPKEIMWFRDRTPPGQETELFSQNVWVDDPPRMPASSLDFHHHGLETLRQYPWLSSPEECYRPCREGDRPKICYYHFTLQLYNVLGKACDVCSCNSTSSSTSQGPTCQCVRADGYERGFLAINRQLPGPSIEVCKGDRVVVDVMNMMDGIETTLHWHGIQQRGTQYYDGVPFVTQCPIHSGNTFRYQYLADDPGTYFYHSHSGFQKLDGLHGALIIREPQCDEPNGQLYDYDRSEHVLVLSDWMHDYAMEHFPGHVRKNTGQNPDTILINGKGQYQDPKFRNLTDSPLEVFTVTPGRRYRFRIISSLSTVCSVQLTIQDHRMTVIATDSEPVQPVCVDSIISYSGERYDVVVNADQEPGSYWIQAKGVGSCGDNNKVYQLAILRYSRSSRRRRTKRPFFDNPLPSGIVLNPINIICNRYTSNAICINQLRNAGRLDRTVLVERPDVQLYLPYKFFNYDNLEKLFVPNQYNKYLLSDTAQAGIVLIDDISYHSAPSPLISQLQDIPPGTLCNSKRKPADCGANCSCTHIIDIPFNAIVEVILVDEVGKPEVGHPFHLHGHFFQVLAIGGPPPNKTKAKMSVKYVKELDRRGRLRRNFDSPPSKDTIPVPMGGYAVIRFRADNPGYWFFHCHFLYHISVGMSMVFHVGAQSDLPPVPHNFPTCGSFMPPIRTR